MRTKISFSFPLGGIISFTMLVYLIWTKLWFSMGGTLEFFIAIGFIFLTLVGWIEYEKVYDT